MTVRKPEDKNIFQWAADGLDLKTIVLFAVALVTTHFMQVNRITVVEQGMPEIQREVDNLNQQTTNIRKDFVRKDQYVSDMAHVDTSLHEILTSQQRIEDWLMKK